MFTETFVFHEYGTLVRILIHTIKHWYNSKPSPVSVFQGAVTNQKNHVTLQTGVGAVLCAAGAVHVVTARHRGAAVRLGGSMCEGASLPAGVGVGNGNFHQEWTGDFHTFSAF